MVSFCPLLRAMIDIHGKKCVSEKNCLQDSCAWWIFDRMGEGACAVKIIAYGAIAHE